MNDVSNDIAHTGINSNARARARNTNFLIIFLIFCFIS